MAQPNLIKIGQTGDIQTLSAFGRNWLEGWEEGLTREDRASDGTLRRDVITRKRKFTLSYEVADQDVVARLEALHLIDDVLQLQVTHLTTTTSYVVLMGIFDKTRLLAVHGGMWQGITVELREV